MREGRRPSPRFRPRCVGQADGGSLSQEGRVHGVHDQGQREEQVRGFLPGNRPEPLDQVMRDFDLDHRVDEDVPLERPLHRTGALRCSGTVESRE